MKTVVSGVRLAVITTQLMPTGRLRPGCLSFFTCELGMVGAPLLQGAGRSTDVSIGQALTTV